MRSPAHIFVALLLAAALSSRAALAARVAQLPSGSASAAAHDSADSARTKGAAPGAKHRDSSTGLTLVAVGFAVLGGLIVATQRKTAASE